MTGRLIKCKTMTKTIEEMNADMARFMGSPLTYYKEDSPTYTEDGKQIYASFDCELSIINNKPFDADQLKYHNSYDWIMPVWERFRDFRFNESSEFLWQTHEFHKAKISLAFMYQPITEAHALLHSGIVWLNSIQCECTEHAHRLGVKRGESRFVCKKCGKDLVKKAQENLRNPNNKINSIRKEGEDVKQ